MGIKVHYFVSTATKTAHCFPWKKGKEEASGLSNSLKYKRKESENKSFAKRTEEDGA